MLKKLILGMGCIGIATMLPFSRLININSKEVKKNQHQQLITTRNKVLPFFHPCSNLPKTTKITQIFKDQGGKIWVGTSKGLYKSIDNGITFSPILLSGSSELINSITQDAGRGIWVATTKGVYWADDEINFEFKFNIIANVIYQNQAGDILMATPNKVYYININSLIMFNVSTGDGIPNKILQGQGGYIYVLTSQGIYLLQRDRYSSKGPYKSSDFPVGNTSNQQGIKIFILSWDVWFATRHGLYKFNDDQHLTLILKGNITDVYKDASNNIWVGTSKGLYKSTDEGLTFNRINYQFKPSTNINSIMQEKSGEILIGTNTGLYKSIDGITFYQSQSSLNFINQIIGIGYNTLLVTDKLLLSNKNDMFNISYADGATSKAKLINDKQYYLSDKILNLNVNPANCIVVDGTSKSSTTKIETFPLGKGEHKISITKRNFTYSFVIWIDPNLSNGLNLMSWSNTRRYLDIYLDNKYAGEIISFYPSSGKQVNIFDFLIQHKWIGDLESKSLYDSFKSFFHDSPEEQFLNVVGGSLSRPAKGDIALFASAFANKLTAMNTAHKGVVLHIELSKKFSIINKGKSVTPVLGISHYWDKIAQSQ